MGLLKDLKQRGLTGVRLIISDPCLGLVEALADVYPDADWQRCVVHFYRNVFSHVPNGKIREVAAMLKGHPRPGELLCSRSQVQGRGQDTESHEAWQSRGARRGPHR